MKKDRSCPLCGKQNGCGYESCWCAAEVFPSEILDLVPRDKLGKSCICKDCLDRFKENTSDSP
ncbi:hypothetical protein DUZ99_18010 [Xylanibacillus composti]|nr:cysteine-rich CWC family protein [Xylanibacillus composti]MDT9726876.1 hypothetical protein [Xylanibacillus composti]